MSQGTRLVRLTRRNALAAVAGAFVAGSSSLLAACGGASSSTTGTSASTVGITTTASQQPVAVSTSAVTSPSATSSTSIATTSVASTSATTTTAPASTVAATSTATSALAASVVTAPGTINVYAYVASPAEVTIWPKYAKFYESKHPDIHIDVTANGKVGNNGDYISKLVTMIAGGTPPDIVMLYNLVSVSLAAKGSLLDLNPYIARDKFSLDDFYPVAYQPFQWNNKQQLGFGTDVYTIGFYYVPNMFAASGTKVPDSSWTWNDVRESALKLTKPDKSQFGAEMYNDYARWCTVVWDYGGEFFDRDIDPRKATFTQQSVVDALSQWVDMVNKDHSVPTSAEMYADNSNKSFEFGTIAMDLVDAPGIVGAMKAAKSSFTWAIAPYPKGPSGKNTTMGMANGLEITKGSKQPDLAWQLFQWYLSPEFMTMLATDTGRMPSRKSLATSDVYLKPFKDAGVLHPEQIPDSVTYARALASSPVNDQIRQIANKEMGQAWNGKRPVKDSLDAIQTQVQAALDTLPK